MKTRMRNLRNLVISICLTSAFNINVAIACSASASGASKGLGAGVGEVYAAGNTVLSYGASGFAKTISLGLGFINGILFSEAQLIQQDPTIVRDQKETVNLYFTAKEFKEVTGKGCGGYCKAALKSGMSIQEVYDYYY
jgi:hypothetical protein